MGCSVDKIAAVDTDHVTSRLTNTKMEDLQRMVEDLEVKTKEERDKVQLLQTRKASVKTRAAELKARVQSECQALSDVIRERRVAMETKVDEAERMDIQTIQGMIYSCHERVKNASSVLKEAKNISKKTNDVNFLKMSEEVEGKIEACNKTFSNLPADQPESQLHNLDIDLRLTRVELGQTDLGTVPSNKPGLSAPVICKENCRTSFDMAYIEWESDDSGGVCEVQCSKEDESTEEHPIIVQNIRGNSCAVRGLSSDTRYRVQVCATDDNRVCPSESITMETPPFFFRFDPQTAGKRLHLSERNTRAVKGDAIPSLPDVPGRFKTSTVFGDAAMAGGRHYWEVGTENARYYFLGVAYGDVSREVNIGETAGGWGIERTSVDTYKAHDQGNSHDVNFSPHPEKIGVVVDYNAGFVTFQDADSKKVIHTFKVRFERPVYPAFSLWIGLGGISSVLTLHTGVSMPQ